MDEGLDIKIDGLKELVLSKLDAMEKFQKQHFDLNEMAIKKAEEAMLLRLGEMNNFREQIREERGTYATKEALAAAIKERDRRLGELESSNAFSAGKLWMVMAIFAAVPTILALIALFIK